MPFSLLIEEDAWHQAISQNIDNLVERVCRLTLQRASVLDILLPNERVQLTLSTVLTNDSSIQELNRQFRMQDKPTNVLSFPAYEEISALKFSLAAPLTPFMIEDAAYLGDLILAYETIFIEAKQQDKKFEDHFTHLLVHGTLHLLGYDHMEPQEAEEMENLEIRILQELSIANPYE